MASRSTKRRCKAATRRNRGSNGIRTLPIV
jgi:hypothetical protein